VGQGDAFNALDAAARAAPLGSDSPCAIPAESITLV
jgi:hypothetical protein